MVRRPLISAALMAVLLTQLGCAKTVRLGGLPKNARVTVNGERVSGQPPAFTDVSGMGKTYVVHVEAPGYEPLSTTFRQEANAACMIGWGLCGCFTMIGFAGMLFCNSLPRDAYYLSMEPAQGGEQSAPPAPREWELETNEVLPTDPPL